MEHVIATVLASCIDSYYAILNPPRPSGWQTDAEVAVGSVLTAIVLAALETTTTNTTTTCKGENLE